MSDNYLQWYIFLLVSYCVPNLCNTGLPTVFIKSVPILYHLYTKQQNTCSEKLIFLFVNSCTVINDTTVPISGKKMFNVYDIEIYVYTYSLKWNYIETYRTEKFVIDFLFYNFFFCINKFEHETFLFHIKKRMKYDCIFFLLLLLVSCIYVVLRFFWVTAIYKALNK